MANMIEAQDNEGIRLRLREKLRKSNGSPFDLDTLVLNSKKSSANQSSSGPIKRRHT